MADTEIVQDAKADAFHAWRHTGHFGAGAANQVGDVRRGRKSSTAATTAGGLALPVVKSRVVLIRATLPPSWNMPESMTAPSHPGASARRVPSAR